MVEKKQSWIERKLRDIQLDREAEGVYKRERELAKGQIQREEDYQEILSGKRSRQARVENVKRALNAIGSWARSVQDGIVKEEPRQPRKPKPKKKSKTTKKTE